MYCLNCEYFDFDKECRLVDKTSDPAVYKLVSCPYVEDFVSDDLPFCLDDSEDYEPDLYGWEFFGELIL